MQRFDSSEASVVVEDSSAFLTSSDGLLQEHQEDEAVPMMTADERDLENQRRKKASVRIVALDLMRGLIMIVMAWDHTKDIHADADWMPKHRGSEGWMGQFSSYDDDWWWFIARAVSNICAPGFFFTMGISITLFSFNRMHRLSWTWPQVLWHFAVRAAILFVIGRLVNPPFMLGGIVQLLKGNSFQGWHQLFTPKDLWIAIRSAFLGVFEVMTGLSLVMFFAGPFVLFPVYKLHECVQRGYYDSHSTSLSESLLSEETRTLGKSWKAYLPTFAEIICYGIFLALFALSNTVIVNAQGENFYIDRNNGFPDQLSKARTFWEVVQRFVMIPGKLPDPFGGTSYPLVPWLGVTSLGIGVGFSLEKDAKRTMLRLGFTSILFMVGFILVRFFGGTFGNFRGLPRGDGQRSTDVVHVDKLLAFFITSKYPPSLAFTFLYLSIDLALIFLFHKLESMFPISNPRSLIGAVAQFFWATCKIFGEVPLFFYVVHFWMIGLLSALTSMLTDKYKVSLPMCVVIWLGVVAFLRPLSIWYGEFKSTTRKDSFWRYI